MPKNFRQEQIKGVIQNSNSFAILTHERPDGDAISSALAMYWYIKSNLSDVEIDIIIPEYPKKFYFLPGFDNIKTEPNKEQYDMLIIVDVSEPHRINGYDVVAKYCSKTICFDHHEDFGLEGCNAGILNPAAPSTTAILFDLFGNVCTEFLECILTGILSDTQNLTFNTNDVTVCTVRAIEKLGVDVKKFKKLVSMKDPRTVELTKLALRRITESKFSNRHNVIFSYINQYDLLKEEQSLAIVDYKQIIKDILEKMKTDVLVLAIENNRNEWKISIRSRIPELDLNALCKRLVESDNSCFLKGGGHSYSAGMTAMGKYEDIISKINANLAEKLA